VSVDTVVVADTTAPTFPSGPSLGLRQGTVNKTGIPVTLSWRATDDTRLARVTATSPSKATFAATSTAWNTVAGPGVRTYALTATDAAGNTRAATTSGNAIVTAETAAVRTGPWGATRNSSHVDGVALSSAVRNASLTWTFTGRSVAWIATRTQWSGQAVVYLDGVKQGTVDLKGGYTSYRQSVFTRSALSSGRHTLRVVVVGTAGRPTVITDGIVSVT
jgi:hypothetical protein